MYEPITLWYCRKDPHRGMKLTIDNFCFGCPNEQLGNKCPYLNKMTIQRGDKILKIEENRIYVVKGLGIYNDEDECIVLKDINNKWYAIVPFYTFIHDLAYNEIKIIERNDKEIK